MREGRGFRYLDWKEEEERPCGGSPISKKQLKELLFSPSTKFFSFLFFFFLAVKSTSSCWFLRLVSRLDWKMAKQNFWEGKRIRILKSHL